MKRVKGRARDERRLVGDPEMLHRLVGIHKENALFEEPKLAKQCIAIEKYSPYFPGEPEKQAHTLSPISVQHERGQLQAEASCQRGEHRGFQVCL